MVSFSCEGCGDVLTKKSLDKHRNQCRGASFTCLDCMTWFHGTDYRSHTSCISEAQKVQGHLYREKDKKGDKRKSVNNDDTMVPRRAYVEDAPEGDESQSQAVAIVEVPPRAPTPPSAAPDLPEDVNVFDFLVSEATPNGASKTISAHEVREIEPPTYRHNGDSQYSQYTNDGSQFSQYGFSYGHAPIEPTFSRYDSWHNLNDSQQSQTLMPPPTYVTPAPKTHRREDKDRSNGERSTTGKRKRGSPEGLDLSTSKRPSSRDEMMIDAPSDGRNGRVLHSGLTGGLNKLITDPEFLEDRIEAGPTPILSPIKRSRRDDTTDKKSKRDVDAAEKKSRRASSYISHSTTTKPASSSSRHVSDEKHDRDRAFRSTTDRKYHDDSHHRRRTHSADRSPDRSNNHTRHRTRHRDSRSSSPERGPTRQKQIEYHHQPRPSSVQPNAANQLISYSTATSGSSSRGDFFMSLIQKGPESERGCSINKVLKRYHRERDVRSDGGKEEESKELWKCLRVRRNERGEIVLFI